MMGEMGRQAKLLIKGDSGEDSSLAIRISS